MSENYYKEVYPGIPNKELLNHFLGEVDCLHNWAHLKNFSGGDIVSVRHEVGMVYYLFKDIERRKEKGTWKV